MVVWELVTVVVCVVVVGDVVSVVVGVVVGDVISHAENTPCWNWCVAMFSDGTRSIQCTSLAANKNPPTPHTNVVAIGVM